jgi:hypothetical protein
MATESIVLGILFLVSTPFWLPFFEEFEPVEVMRQRFHITTLALLVAPLTLYVSIAVYVNYGPVAALLLHASHVSCLWVAQGEQMANPLMAILVFFLWCLGITPPHWLWATKKHEALCTRDHSNGHRKRIPLTGDGLFKARWLVRNTGVFAWPRATTLVFEGNDGPSLVADDTVEVDVVDVPQIKPGAETVITIELQAPEQVGKYDLYFRLRAPDGNDFGDVLLRKISVFDESFTSLSQIVEDS